MHIAFIKLPTYTMTTENTIDTVCFDDQDQISDEIVMPQIRIKLVRLEPVGIWKFQQDYCSICRNKLVDSCIGCLTSGNIERCPVSKGICGDIFHAHCIQNFLKESSKCPVCFKEYSTCIQDLDKDTSHKIEFKKKQGIRFF